MVLSPAALQAGGRRGHRGSVHLLLRNALPRIPCGRKGCTHIANFINAEEGDLWDAGERPIHASMRAVLLNLCTLDAGCCC